MSRYGFDVLQESDTNDPVYVAALEAFIASRPDGYFGHMADPARPKPPKIDRWKVELPHQCDEWKITEDYYGYVSHESAVASLNNFIAEAQEALDRLNNREQVQWVYDRDSDTYRRLSND